MSVLIGYLSDYGYSDRLSQAIGRGLVKTGVAVEMVDLRAVDPQELIEAVSSARGIVLGTPPSQPSEAVATALSTIFAAAHNKQAIGLFDSYGGDDEPIDALLAQFRNLGLHTAFPPIRVKDQPTEAIYQQCEESGTDLGQWLTRADAIQTMKSLEHHHHHH
uniref:Flavodoxin-like domain n=1 Tax=Synechococcus sp. (strain ATCC 27144 / PCC 6301 / SAUG 1402/1) TaxID=269084 RepID=UPI0001A5DE8E